MTFQEIMRELDGGKYRPIYFLCGEENYYTDVITDRIEHHLLTEEERDFNQTVLYGNETNMGEICDTARKYPMMAERQVLIVKEAQNIKDWEPLLPYLGKFQPTTLLLFAYRQKPDKRKSVFKKLSSSPEFAYLESTKIYDNMLPAWIDEYIKSGGRTAERKAVMMLAESLGTDLSKVANEIDKLFTVVPKGGNITMNLVESLVGISKEFNNFELIDALASGDALKCSRIVNYFESNPKSNPFPVTLALLFRYFNNLLTYIYQLQRTPNPQDVAKVTGMRPMEIRSCQSGAKRFSAGRCVKIIEFLKECDMRSKGATGVTIPDAEILREIVFKILHPAS